MTNNTTAKPKPAMAVLSIGFTEYVMPVKQATEIIRCMETAERYSTRYRTKEDGGPLHYLWQEQVEARMHLLSNDTYIQGKFTGKPDDR